jgi:hypothetical protein
MFLTTCSELASLAALDRASFRLRNKTLRGETKRFAIGLAKRLRNKTFRERNLKSLISLGSRNLAFRGFERFQQVSFKPLSREANSCPGQARFERITMPQPQARQQSSSFVGASNICDKGGHVTNLFAAIPARPGRRPSSRQISNLTPCASGSLAE